MEKFVENFKISQKSGVLRQILDEISVLQKFTLYERLFWAFIFFYFILKFTVSGFPLKIFSYIANV